jgi:hypothetical protein
MYSFTDVSISDMIHSPSTVFKQIDICGITHGAQGTLDIHMCKYLQLRTDKIDIQAWDIQYILESNPHPILIRTSFCLLLKRKIYFAVLIRNFPSTAPCLKGRLIE